MTKFFFIGFNKTGTSTYHNTLSPYIRSTHNIKWPKKSRNAKNLDYFKKFDCYSDGELADFKRLAEAFPDANFILNTRGLYSWIYSRIKHIYRNYPGGAKGWMAREWHSYSDKSKIIKLWITRRNNYYRKVLRYFHNRTNFKLLNISDKNLKGKLESFTGFPIKKVVNSNIQHKDLPVVQGFTPDIYKAFMSLGIKEEDYNTPNLIIYVK